MSKNINQVFGTNPITSNAGTDLMYFGQSPYGATNDAAMLYSNFKAQFLLSGVQTLALNMGGFQINNAGAPSLATDVATKGYVDQTAIIGTQAYAGTTAALTVTQAGAGIGATLTNAGAQATFALDGVNPPVNSIVIIKNQASNTQNGLYSVTNVGSGATNWVLTRSTSYDTPTDINDTGSIVIQHGTTLTSTSWYNTTTMVTVDTTAITFAQSGAALPLSLANGGNNASLTANNGGIFYSTSTSAAILAGTATAQQILLSGASTTPQWSTSTYPLTNAINTLLFASAANVMSALATANGGVLVTSNTGVPSILAGSGSTGTILQATSGGTPAWSTTTYPATNAINTIMFASSANVLGVISPVNSAVLSSNGSGVPSMSTTLPSGLAATNLALTTPSLGTPSSGTLTNCTGLPLTTGVTGILPLANGGSNANLVASNGGIVWSNASQMQILAGTATANQILLSGSSATPAWSTTTYPATNAINTIMYASAANVLSSIAAANNSILQTNGSGVPSFSTSLPSATVFISTVDQASASVTLAVNTQYVTDAGASLVTYTLPTTCAIGSIFIILGKGSGGWKVAQSAGQQIQVGSSASTSGATGSIASSNQWDCVVITCVTANNIFVCHSVQGNLTVT